MKQSLIAAGGGLGSYVGSNLGNSKLGRSMGSRLGARISRMIGSGDYTLGELPAHNTLIKGKIPSAVNFGEKSVRMCHREYVGDIFTGINIGEFNVQSFPVNASYSATFPYLAAIAAQFEQYKFHGLIFEFVSTCSNYINGSSLGSIILASQFNTSLPDFISKSQMENCENAISARMDRNVLYGVECASQVQNWYYTRHIGAGAGLNSNVANIYDLCDFQIATVGGGVPENTSIGEMWVSYDVELTGPRMPDLRSGYYHLSSTDYTNALPLGANRREKAFGYLSGATATSSVIRLNNTTIGDVISISMRWKGTGSVSGSIGFLTEGLTEFPFLSGTTHEVGSTTGNTYMYTSYYTITSRAAYITVSSGSLPTGGTNMDVVITSMAYGVASTTL